MAKPKVQFFNIYDSGGTLRSMADEAARLNDESRSRLVRRAIANEVKKIKEGK